MVARPSQGLRNAFTMPDDWPERFDGTSSVKCVDTDGARGSAIIEVWRCNAVPAPPEHHGLVSVRYRAVAIDARSVRGTFLDRALANTGRIGTAARR
jgi:hypothetical protein